MLLSLLLSLFIFLPNLIETKCHDHRYGVPSNSCKRIKDPKFQIRGDIRIVPMWEFILLNEGTGKRFKRDVSTHQNGTLHATHSGGRTLFQPLPISPQKWNPNYVPTQPSRSFVPPVDSSAPLPVTQRHIVERQVLPVLHQAPVYNLNPYNAHSNTAQNYKRPEAYHPVPPQSPYKNNIPNLNHFQGYPPQNPPRQPIAIPSPHSSSQTVSNYNHPPQQRFLHSQLQTPQVIPQKKVIENSNWSSNERNKSSNEGGRISHRTEKNQKKKKGKSSKMCKLCRELSEEEEESEEKKVACEFCEKSKQENGKPRNTLKTGRVQGKNKGRNNKKPDGEEDEIENITDEDEKQNEDEYDQAVGKSDSPKTIIDFAERAEQNKQMRIPVYRGKKIENKDSYSNGSDENGDEYKNKEDDEDEKSEFSTNIREGEQSTKYSDKPNVKYSYPPKDTLPLQTCFHNPSGYVCCNLELNNVVESTYKEIKESPNFNACNLQVIANKLQRASEKMFEHPFESVVSHADFAQNINFAGDLVCKLEIDGKYMIAYGTPYHADDAVGPQGPDGNPLPVRSLKL
uniref:Ground-like domain-containing protein n=1 Tax=Caenorhabditis tropicalis TaxID=1561998 RepID=A0A1I7TFA2_9PELO